VGCARAAPIPRRAAPRGGVAGGRDDSAKGTHPPPRRGGWAGGAARGALGTGQAWQGVGAFREGCPRHAACAGGEQGATHPPRGSGSELRNAGGWGVGAGGRHTDGLAGGNARSEARRRQLKGAPPRTQASAKGDGTVQAWAGCGGWVAGCPLHGVEASPRRAQGVPPRRVGCGGRGVGASPRAGGCPRSATGCPRGGGRRVWGVGGGSFRRAVAFPRSVTGRAQGRWWGGWGGGCGRWCGGGRGVGGVAWVAVWCGGWLPRQDRLAMPSSVASEGRLGRRKGSDTPPAVGRAVRRNLSASM